MTLGAQVVDPVALPPPAAYEDAEFEVLLHEFKAGLAAYLAEFARPRRSATSLT